MATCNVVLYAGRDTLKIAMQADPKHLKALAGSPFIRPRTTENPGEEYPDFDIPYAIAVFDAKERVQLMDLIEANPGKIVRHPNGRMGYVPNDLE